MRNSPRSLCPLAVLAVLANPALAQKQRPLGQSIPASARVVVQFAGLAGCRKSWHEHGLAAIVQDAIGRLDDRQRAHLLAPWQREVAPRAREWLRRVGLSPVTLRALLRGPCAVVIGRPTVASGLLMPSLALMLDATDAQTSADQLVARLAALAGAHGSSEEVVQGVATLVLTLDNPGVRRIYAGRVGGRLVLSNSRGLYAEILATARGRGRSVTALPAYRAGRQHLRGRALGSVWLNAAPLIAGLQPFLPYEAASIGTALGLGEFRGVFLGAGTDGNLGTEVCHVGWRGDARGLFRAPVGKPVALDVAARCSPDTVAFAAAHVDPTALFSGLRSAYGRLPAWLRTAFAKRVADRLGHAVPDLDAVPRHLAALTGDFAIACSLPKALPIPEVTVFVGVRDAKQVTEDLRRVMARLHGEPGKTQRFLDVDIHHITVSVDHVGIAPCFACKDGVLMISTHPRILKATLRRWQKQGPSLRDRPEWRDAARRARGCTSLAFVATGDIAQRLVGVAQVATWLRRELHARGVNPNVLPEAADLRRALGSIVITTRVDRDGFTWVSRSPVFDGSVLAAAGAVLDRALRELMGRDL